MTKAGREKGIAEPGVTRVVRARSRAVIADDHAGFLKDSTGSLSFRRADSVL